MKDYLKSIEKKLKNNFEVEDIKITDNSSKHKIINSLTKINTISNLK